MSGPRPASFPLEVVCGRGAGEGPGGTGCVIQSGLDKVRRMKRRDARRNEPAPSSFCVVRPPKLNIRRDLRANERAAKINPRLLCYSNEIVEGLALLGLQRLLNFASV